VFEEVAEGREVKDQEVRNILGTMLFRGDDIDKPVGLLSGGERARVRLCQLLIDKPNVLVLDEPTNHLDIPSREALEGGAGGFPRHGAVRQPRPLFSGPGSQADVCVAAAGPGGFRRYVQRMGAQAGRNRKDEQAAKQKPRTSARDSRPKNTQSSPERAREKKDNPYSRPFGRLSLKELEQQITETEIALAECQSGFGSLDGGRDTHRSRKLRAEFDSLTKKLKDLETEYFRARRTRVAPAT